MVVNMEYRKRNISFNKAGGTAKGNSYSPKLSIPKKWLNEMNVTPDDKTVDIIFNKQQIIILKTKGNSK